MSAELNECYNSTYENGTSIESSTDLQTNCELCDNQLTDPVLLQCLHVFDKGCLLAMESQRINANQMKCPKCDITSSLSHFISLKNYNLSTQKNLLSSTDDDFTNDNSEYNKCILCTTGEIGVYKCPDCAGIICERCYNLHKEVIIFQSHQNVEELTKNEKENIKETVKYLFNTKPVKCSIHKEDNLESYCYSCHAAVCDKCGTSDHKGHDINQLSDLLSTKGMEIDNLVTKSKMVQEKMTDRVDQMTNLLSDVAKSLDINKSRIEEISEIWKAVIDEMKEEFYAVNKSLHDNLEYKIMSQINEDQKRCDHLEYATEFVNNYIRRCPLVEASILVQPALECLSDLCSLGDSNLQQHLMGLGLGSPEPRSPCEFPSSMMSASNVQLHLPSTDDIRTFVRNNFGSFPGTGSGSSPLMDAMSMSVAAAVGSFAPSTAPGTHAHQQQQQQQQLFGNNHHHAHTNATVAGVAHHSMSQQQFSHNFRSPDSSLLGLVSSDQTDNMYSPYDDLSRELVAASSTSNSFYKMGSGNLPGRLSGNGGLMNSQQSHASPQANGGIGLIGPSDTANNVFSSPPVSAIPLHQQQQQPQHVAHTPNEFFSFSGEISSPQPTLLSSSKGSLLSSSGIGTAHTDASPHSCLQTPPGRQQRTPPVYDSGGSPQQTLQSTLSAGSCSTTHQQQQQMSVPPPTPSSSHHMGSLDCTGHHSPHQIGSGPVSGSSSQMTSQIAPPNSLQSVPPALLGSPSSAFPITPSFRPLLNMNPVPKPPFPRNRNYNPMVIKERWGCQGSSRGQLNSPHGFCLGFNEEIVVADTQNHRIQIFSKDGQFISQFGIAGREEGHLWHPRKVTIIRGTQHYVVCDRGSERSRMQIFAKNGYFIRKIGIPYIDIVAGLAINNQGHIVAVDSVSPTIFVVTEMGDMVKWIECSSHMREPSDIVVHGDNYYICDFKGHCVCVYKEDGTFLFRFGNEKITNYPNGIDVSNLGDILVGDSHGNRFHVAVFSKDGNLTGEFECPSVKVSRACGLKITSEGYLVTLAKNNHNVLVIDTLYVN